MLYSKIETFNTLRPRQNGRLFADDTLKRIFLNENSRISIKISLKFVPKGPINNIPALVQIMAWRRPGDKPLSEPMMVSLPTHICVTRPQWVKPISEKQPVTLPLITITSMLPPVSPPHIGPITRKAFPCHYVFILVIDVTDLVPNVAISIMMTSSNGKNFRVTGHLCGEFTGHRWISRRKVSDAELWCFLSSASE